MIATCDGMIHFKSYRKLANYRKSVEQVLKKFESTEIWSTCSRGPQLWAADYARRKGIELHLYLPCKENKNSELISEKEYRERQLARKYAQRIVYVDRFQAPSHCAIPMGRRTKSYLDNLDLYVTEKSYWASWQLTSDLPRGPKTHNKIMFLKHDHIMGLFQPSHYLNIYIDDSGNLLPLEEEWLES